MFTAFVARDGTRLAVNINQHSDRWLVMALTGPDGAETPDEVFADHSHKTVGSYDTPKEAFDAAESFARAWLKNFKSTRSRACDCDELKPG